MILTARKQKDEVQCPANGLNCSVIETQVLGKHPFKSGLVIPVQLTLVLDIAKALLLASTTIQSSSLGNRVFIGFRAYLCGLCFIFCLNFPFWKDSFLLLSFLYLVVASAWG